jgi:uncharacterized protein (TIGR02001 family)
MHRQASWLMAAAALAAVPSQAAASWHATVTVATDYLFRGFSRSDTDTALQAGLRYRHSTGFSAGLWGSTVQFAADGSAANERRVEVHGFAGYSAPLTEDWSLSAFLLRYEYPGASAEVDESYSEAEVSLAYRGLLQASLAYTPDVLASGFRGLFVELSGRYPLPHLVDLSGGIGRAELDTPFDASYTYGHLGVGWSHRGIDLELGYYRTDSRPIPRWGAVADGRLALSLSARFPRER